MLVLVRSASFWLKTGGGGEGSAPGNPLLFYAEEGQVVVVPISGYEVSEGKRFFIS